MAKTTSDTKAASYDIIATTLREKIHVPKEQFKAFFLALLADKEYTRIFDTIAKVEKSFRRPTPYFRTQARGNLRSSPYPRITCYRCGTPGHKTTQCWKRVSAARNFSPGHPGHNNPDLPLSNMRFDAIEVKQTSLQCVLSFCIPPFSKVSLTYESSYCGGIGFNFANILGTFINFSRRIFHFYSQLLPLGWHSQRESHFPFRITGAEFAIPWAVITSTLFFFSFHPSLPTLSFMTGKK